MTSPGPSPEYRDLLNGRITPDEYVEKIKVEVDESLEHEREAADSREAPAARTPAAA